MFFFFHSSSLPCCLPALVLFFLRSTTLSFFVWPARYPPFFSSQTFQHLATLTTSTPTTRTHARNAHAISLFPPSKHSLEPNHHHHHNNKTHCFPVGLNARPDKSSCCKPSLSIDQGVVGGDGETKWFGGEGLPGEGACGGAGADLSSSRARASTRRA